MSTYNDVTSFYQQYIIVMKPGESPEGRRVSGAAPAPAGVIAFAAPFPTAIGGACG
jgi:hypothetical protein